MVSAAHYTEISAIARKRRAANIAAFYPEMDVDEAALPNNLTEHALKSGYYTTDELEIIESEAEDILEKIRDGIWTSMEVTEAFCKASALAQQLVSLFVRMLIPRPDCNADQLCHRSSVL